MTTSVAPPTDSPSRDVVRIRRAAVGVLSTVALVGAVLSWLSLYRAAVGTFGPVLAAGFPLLTDCLILGAALAHIAGAKVGRPRAGWRLTAHAAVVGTIALNALASPDLAHVPWHVVAPAVWSVLVELAGREVIGEWRAAHRGEDERIPARLWLTSPRESARTWLRLARRVEGAQASARLEAALQSAAVEGIRIALPGHRARRARRILISQVRAGSIDSAAVLRWADGRAVGRSAERMRDGLRVILHHAGAPALALPGEVPTPAVEPSATAPALPVLPPLPAPAPAARTQTDPVPEVLTLDLRDPAGSPSVTQPETQYPTQTPPGPDRTAPELDQRPAPHRPTAPGTKRAAFAAALDETGSVTSALKLLQERGEPAPSRGHAFTIARELAAQKAPARPQLVVAAGGSRHNA